MTVIKLPPHMLGPSSKETVGPGWDRAELEALTAAFGALLTALKLTPTDDPDATRVLLAEHAARAESAGGAGQLAWARLLRTRAHVIARGGAAGLLQAAYAEGDNAVVSAATERWLERGEWDRPWLKRLGRPVDPERRACDLTLAAHTHGARGVVALPDGRRAVSAGGDGVLRVWDLSTGACIATLASDARADTTAMALHPDGARLVAGGADGVLRVWDLSTGACIATLATELGAVSSVLAHPEGTRVVAAGTTGHVVVWVLDAAPDAASWKLTGHVGPVAQLALHSDGRRVLSAGADGAVRVWDLAHGPESLFGPARTDAVAWVGFAPDGRRALSLSTRGTLRVWDMMSGDCVSSNDTGVARPRGAALRPDGRLIILGDDFTLYEWFIEARFLTEALLGGGMSGAVLSPDGRYAVLWEAAGTVQVRDTQSWNLRALVDVAGLREVLTLPGDRLLLVTREETLQILDIAMNVVSVTLAPGDRLDLHGRLYTDGDLLASARAGRALQAVVLETGDVLATQGHHDGEVRGVALRPDVPFVLSVGDDGALRAWDRETGAALARWDGDAAWTAVALGKDGQIVAGDAAGGVYLFR